MKTTITLFALALGLTAIAPQASAGQAGQTMKVAFHTSVVVAGTHLEPGTYVFERLNSGSMPSVVRVLSEDGMKTLVVFQTNRAQLDRIAEKAEVEIGANGEVLGWTYPGETAKTVIVE